MSGVTSPEEFEKAVELIRRGDEAEGVARLERLLEKCPEDVNVLGALAFALLNQRRWTRSAELYSRLSDTMPSCLGGAEFYYWAWAEAAGGRHREAVKLCEEALRRCPDEPRARELGACCAFRSGAVSQALQFIPVTHEGRIRSDDLPCFDLARLPANLRLELPRLWVMMSFFARFEHIGGVVQPLGRGRKWQILKRLAASVRSGAARLGRGAASERLLWRLWPLHHSWIGGIIEPELLHPDGRDVARFRRVLDTSIDVLLQRPLAPLANVLHAAIRGQDAATLSAWYANKRPKLSVHIGTHIGISACLAALALEETGQAGGAVIHTVDPYLVHGHLNPEALSGEISAILGIEHRLVTHRGFFNHVSPTAVQDGARGVQGTSADQVIGRDLLRQLGPADCFLVDGDHAANGVVADLLLSLEWLAPGGDILLHDVRSIPTVRHGIELFFSEDAIARALTYTELSPASTDGLGLIRRRG